MHSLTGHIGVGRLFVVAVCLAGCASAELITLPSPVSPGPVATEPEGLRAGFAREDITPPPGVSIAGNGPESRQSTGYRHRLYARTILLEDLSGERLALVAVDLPLMSTVLHRRVAARTVAGTGIGADRLLITATHTHAGPGNFLDAAQYNQQGGGLPGYDTVFVDFLIDRIALTVEKAFRDLEPAVARWDTIHVRGVTWNRSLDAFEKNGSSLLPPRPDRTLTTAELRSRAARAVDPVMAMLRIDRCSEGWIECRPKGAYTIFGVHPTGYPAANRLLDGDIFSIVQRGLESHMESLNPSLVGQFTSGAFHVLSNGAVGDVSPRHFAGSRCERKLRQESGLGPAGPGRPESPEAWLSPSGWETECLEVARRSVNASGDQLAEAAKELFDRATERDRLSKEVTLARAFVTVNLPSMATEGGVCGNPRSGVSQVGGSWEDAATRMYGWRVLGLFPSGMEEGERARRRKAKGCHGTKRILLGSLQGSFVGRYGFPEFAQLGVIRIGDTMLATLPWEVTNTTGRQIEAAIKAVVPNSIHHVRVTSLSNGYLSYLTTAEEYSAQHYEGGSNLYGPQTARVVTQRLAEMADSLADGTPIVDVAPITIRPGPRRSYFASAERGRIPKQRSFQSASCSENVLTATWIDAAPGPLLPSAGPLLWIERQVTHQDGTGVVWDDDRSVEVRALGPAQDGYLWEVRWLPDQHVNAAHRVVLIAETRAGVSFPEVVGSWVSCSE